MSEETVTITKKEHDRLLSRDEWLGYLESAGVDNWQGYEHACDEAREAGYYKRMFDED